jgi:hypothetical protein
MVRVVTIIKMKVQLFAYLQHIYYHVNKIVVTGKLEQ